jgi:AcrR family transcriptional regulator
MSELVERSGAPAATIRYYFSEGLLPPPTHAASNRYLYDERHVEIVRFVRLLRDRRGLSLEEIRGILPDLLPDFLGAPSPGVFRPEMFAEFVAVAARRSTAPTVADQLVDAALDAFSARGIAEVSVDDICRAVKIAKGSFYRHFSSKEDLVDAATERIPVLFATALSAGGTLEGALRPNLSVVFELAALASRDAPRARVALRALVTKCALALVDAGQAREVDDALAAISGLLGSAAASGAFPAETAALDPQFASPPPRGVVDG